MTPEELSALKKLCEESEENWLSDIHRSLNQPLERRLPVEKFIAAARTALPELLEKIEFLEGHAKLGWGGGIKLAEENAALKAEVERLNGFFPSSEKMKEVVDIFEELEGKLNIERGVNKKYTKSDVILRQENQALRELLGGSLPWLGYVSMDVIWSSVCRDLEDRIRSALNENGP